MYDMTIRLRPGSDVCLYVQIYEHIKREIRDGKLLEGERLPSTRSLAESLQVARSTVDLAYGQLTDEGYIEARPYRGYFVCRLEEPDFGAGSQGQREEAEPEVPVSVPGCDFSPYDIDMSGFPFGVWKKLSKKVLTDADSRLFSSA